MTSRNNIFYSKRGLGANPVLLENSYGRDYNTSPVFNFSNSSSILTSAFYTFDFSTEKPASVKFLPFNILVVTNSSTQKIRVYPNQDLQRGFTVPAGVTRTFTQDQIRFIRSLRIENKGSGTIASNEIDIEVQKDIVTTDNLAKNVHKKLFSNERTDLA